MLDLNIWRIGLTGDEKGKAARFISSTRQEFQPEYSPDGQKIAFESDRSGCEEIWVCNADGSGAFQVTNFGTGWSGSPRWSPDSRELAFDRLEAKKFAIYVINSQGGRPSRATANAGNNIVPSWSRDGHWIYFTSDRTARFEVWKVRSTGGPEVQVTKNGGVVALESTDGGDLYYSRPMGENDTLWRMPLAGGEETKVLEHLAFERAYAVAKHGIYFLEFSQLLAPLRFLDFASRQITTVGSVRWHNLGGRITVSPDERWLLYGQDDGTGSDLMLVENFQ
jgi:Tol biopolymer transport system component